MLALALVLEGASRTKAAQAAGMDRQTLRDWVHRYNAAGVAGLASRGPAGPTPRLDETQMAELEALVLKGPDPATDGVVRWRCADLRRRIKQEFAVALHESTVGKLLRRLDFTRLQPRPYHPKKGRKGSGRQRGGNWEWNWSGHDQAASGVTSASSAGVTSPSISGGPSSSAMASSCM
jgi:transposase